MDNSNYLFQPQQDKLNNKRFTNIDIAYGDENFTVSIHAKTNKLPHEFHNFWTNGTA